MLSKYSPLTLAFYCVLFFGVIAIITGYLFIINNVDGSYSLAFFAFIVSLISLVFSAAATVEVARRTAEEENRRYIEKRLECFYKPIEQIIENPVNIENRAADIIYQLQEIRRYDHLAKEKNTQIRVRELTGASKITTTEISKINSLLDVVKKDIIFYEEELASLSSK